MPNGEWGPNPTRLWPEDLWTGIKKGWSVINANIFFEKYILLTKIALITGKSMSEALILESVNPQYDDRLFIDLRLQYKKNTSSEHFVYKIVFFVLAFKTIFEHNMLINLFHARKVLPVQNNS